MLSSSRWAPLFITVRFGSGEQLLIRGISFRHDGGEGGHGKREGRRRGRRGKKREKEGEDGKQRVVIKLQAWPKRAGTPLSICLWNPQGRDEAVAQEGAHLGPSIEGERAREPRGAHLRCPAREVGVLKRHRMVEGERELRVEFSSLDVPSRGGLPRDIFSIA